MTEDEVRDLVIKHDQALISLASSMEHLASEAKRTNDKLDEVAKALGAQNVLMERQNNMDRNIKESFDRVHEKTRKVETKLENATIAIAGFPSATTIRWFAAILIAYLVAFGVFTVKSIHTNENQITYLKGRIK